MKKKLKPLEHSDNLHLEEAEGWLGLGDLVSANNELEEVSPEMRAHPYVLMMRLEIYHAAKKWEYVMELAETLVKQLPDQAQV